jgi:lipoate-protein ligase A
MALDEALAETVRAGGAPFLRFYFWEPAALSLGRFQNLQTGLSTEAATVPRVRRPTGGGGIWHADELTYSLGCRQDDLNTTGVKASFEILCGFLVDAWRSLGWDAGFAKDVFRAGELGGFTPACFAGQEEYDILVAGKKLGGNAQRRERTTIFQHGSLPRVLDHSVLERLFLPGFRPDPASTTDLKSCGWRGTSPELIPVLAEAFRSRLDVELTEALPTAEEHRRAEALRQERFADPEWTQNGPGRLRQV